MPANTRAKRKRVADSSQNMSTSTSTPVKDNEKICLECEEKINKKDKHLKCHKCKQLAHMYSNAERHFQ